MSNLKTITKAKSIIADCADFNQNDLQKFVQDQGADKSKFDFKNKQERIVLIGAGASAEREVSYMSCTGITRSLVELGYNPIFVDMGEDIAEVLVLLKPIKVFNGIHGTYGEDGCLPGLLNIMRIPYTSCGVVASSVGFNKKKSLEIFRSNRINTANFIFITKSEHKKYQTDPLPRPYVIKPVSQGSSVGIEIVFEDNEFDFASYDFPHGDILVEEYIKGREIQVAVLNGEPLGTLEIELLKGKIFYDYEVKYINGFSRHLCPAPLTKSATKEVMRLAKLANDVIGATGMVRVEFLYNEKSDKFFILEINTHPGMTPLSICPEIALKEKNITYTQIVDKILADSKYEM